ncbi:MAG: hypothetical protein ACJ8EB_10860 [Allosphingosinicella sp.]
MRKSFAIWSVMLLGGCAGYAADYWKPKEQLFAPQLARYGITGGEAQCVSEKLKASLTVWQLRQLADLASRLTPGGQNPATLGPNDFLYIAGLVKDPNVGLGTRTAFSACGVASAPVRAAAAMPQPTSSPGLQPGAAVPPAPPAGTGLWVNLGTAASGQAISVDASSLVNDPASRQGWFRLANPGESGPGALSYRLRIDCPGHSITATAGRKYGPDGGIAEEKAYAQPQGPLPIETGTVMEVAYRALCS